MRGVFSRDRTPSGRRVEGRRVPWIGAAGLAVVLAVLGVAAGAAPAVAETEGDTDAAERAARGRIAYRVHCLNCHGENGDGRGPMAEILKVVPTDLTGLAAANGGEFPAEEVHRAIDGRDDILAHGRRGMPVWGLGLRESGRDTDQEELVREQIRDLVAYVETLQKPASQ